MFSPIQTLPSDVINLIAAGEVIDSLGAVVRELVENSLDAGATRIVVSLFPDLWRIQVADNGRGMTLDDLQVAASPHSTSKIHSTDDLWRITSLGFRGEALHSLAQVADLEILSRISAATAVGWRILYQQGKETTREPTAIAPGTIVNVANLFAPCPIRRQGLPSMSQQLKTVQLIIQQIALCHPQVTWQIWQNEKPWFRISPGNSAQDILPQILKTVNFSDLQLVNLEISDFEQAAKIELVIGLPDRCHRRRPDWIKIAVNGRIVKSSILEQTIISAFAKTLPRDRYPLCFVHLRIPPNQIDWNRHPAKAEIYLHSLGLWQEKIREAIEQALKISAANLPQLENKRVEKLLQVAEAKGDYRLSREIEMGSPQQKANNQLSLISLTAVAQVRNTYIVAEHPQGLWLVEQHIAHERVLYEQIQEHWQLVPLENPIILTNLTPSQQEQLIRLELDIEVFGEQAWAVRTVPAMLKERDDCQDALLEISWGGDLQTAQVAISCRSAIRNGQHLNLEEMQTLLDNWKSTRNPSTCPHGRPIYLSLEESALARFFRRHWVLGKSHGI